MKLIDKIDVYEGFPKEGISFKDLNSLLLDPQAYQEVIRELYDLAKPLDVNKVVSPESRGYIVGCPLAYQLGTAFVPVRKPGKLPGEVLKKTYALEYGEDTLEIQVKAINPGDRVVIVDDLIATGGTLKAIVEMVEELGGEVAGILSLMELTDLDARSLLEGYTIETLLKYNK